ncbi:hypothetical protein L2744_19020 [Shewanella profunda]|uniref:hypothetical protein n=1 Tax=Shewanella profunda TaxID=254793 RepID=UPI00200C1074|nr:hypothetical protein [Shewanella profunda]MCL1091655.1 hypothetical protein [Shewanella profunda]
MMSKQDNLSNNIQQCLDHLQHTGTKRRQLQTQMATKLKSSVIQGGVVLLGVGLIWCYTANHSKQPLHQVRTGLLLWLAPLRSYSFWLLWGLRWIKPLLLARIQPTMAATVSKPTPR